MYNSTFVHEAVNDLLQRSSGKQRLILDVRHVNAFVYKCEDLSVATQIFNKDYCLFKFDLKSGYHHLNFPRAPHIPRICLGLWHWEVQILSILRLALVLLFLYLDPQTASKILEKSEHSYCHFPGRWPRRVKG